MVWSQRTPNSQQSTKPLRFCAVVKARVSELQANVEKEFTLTRVDWLEPLRRVAEKAKDAEDFSASRGCLREISIAMLGWYKPVENNVTVPGLHELLACIIKT